MDRVVAIQNPAAIAFNVQKTSAGTHIRVHNYTKNKMCTKCSIVFDLTSHTYILVDFNATVVKCMHDDNTVWCLLICDELCSIVERKLILIPNKITNLANVLRALQLTNLNI